MGTTAIPEADMKKFVDALKKSVRLRHDKTNFESYLRKKLGADYKKWRRLVEGNRMPLGDIVEAYITKEGAVAVSGENLRGLFLRYQSKGADLQFLESFVSFLRNNRQDALELKRSL